MSIFDKNIETDRLLLRRVRLSDAPDMYEYASNPEVSRHLSWYPHVEVSQSEKYIESLIKEYASEKTFSWAIELVEIQKMIGIVRIFDISYGNRRGELSYILNPEFQGKGLITEALRSVMQFCFDSGNMNRIQARCTPENVSSEKVMQKLGMKYEGTLKAFWINKGKPADAVLYGITIDDYNEQ